MINKLTNRVYYMDYVEHSDRPILALVVGNKCSLVVDGGNSKEHAKEFLSYVKELRVPKVKYLALTHYHWDHVFGMKTMNLVNIVQRKTNEKLKYMKTLRWTDEAIRERVETGEEIKFSEKRIKIEHPDNNRKIEIVTGNVIFDNNIEIDLGGVTVRVNHITTDHSDDCCLIDVVEEGVTFVGDALYLDMYNGPWSYTREKLYSLLSELLSYESNYYIPSHSPKYNNEEFEFFVKYIKEIGDTIGNCTDLEEAVLKIKNFKGKEVLSQSEINDIKGFVEGNRKKFDLN